jgi:hypothetical protein
VLDELQSDLQQIARGIVEQAQIDRGRHWLEAFTVEYPLAHKLLMNALYKSPADVLKILGLIVPEMRKFKGNEYVLKYIEKLQSELRRKKS